VHDYFAAASGCLPHEEGDGNHDGASECKEINDVQVGENARLLLNGLLHLL
jgi:hypothetical protein